jgi:pimeloyl-ACP methyl ester carboxylesterase
MSSRPAAVVLVHGAWHGAWCWEKVLPLLADAGVPALAVDLADPDGRPGDLRADAAAVCRALDTIAGPAVLCGHSYGGMVVTEAGVHPAVAHLVYLAAFVAGVGTSLRDLLSPDPGWLRLEVVVGDDGLTRPDETTIERLYHDCRPADADAARARLRLQHRRGFAQPLSAAAWESVPSTYAVCAEDRAVDPAAQRWMAARVGSETVEWPTGHSPFLSRPDLVAGLIADVAWRADWRD